jgi:hypothetical protein
MTASPPIDAGDVHAGASFHPPVHAAASSAEGLSPVFLRPCFFFESAQGAWTTECWDHGTFLADLDQARQAPETR